MITAKHKHTLSRLCAAYRMLVESYFIFFIYYDKMAPVQMVQSWKILATKYSAGNC